jgi:hypothetical protein
VFDFLRGTHMSKDQIANGNRETHYLALFRRNVRALAYRLRHIDLPAWKAKLQQRPVPKIDW